MNKGVNQGIKIREFNALMSFLVTETHLHIILETGLTDIKQTTQIHIFTRTCIAYT